MIIDHDLHVHTILSSCCHDSFQTPRNIIEYYEHTDVRLVGFADHVWQNPAISPNEWFSDQGPVRLNATIKAMKRLNSPIKILRGCEADTLGPGRCSITRKFAETLDYVILATNHFHFVDLVMQPEYPTPRGIAEHMAMMFLAGVDSGLATIIPHVFIPMGYGDLYDQSVAAISDQRFLNLFGRAAEKNIAIEITLAYLPPPEESPRHSWSLETPVRVLSLARDAGCKFTFGSDAHHFSCLRQLKQLNILTDAIGIDESHLHPISRTMA